MGIFQSRDSNCVGRRQLRRRRAPRPGRPEIIVVRHDRIVLALQDICRIVLRRERPGRRGPAHGNRQAKRKRQSVEADVLEERQDVLSVSEAAIEFSGDSTFVYRLTSSESAVPQQFERIPVSVGMSDGMYIEIKNGVTNDMKLRGNEKTEE